nr:endopeptidase La [bacterium]
MLKTLPLLAMRGLHVFPHTSLFFDAGREESVAAVEWAAESEDKQLFLVAQRDPACEQPDKAALYDIGTLARVRQVLKLPDGHVRILAEGEARARLIQREKGDGYLAATIDVLEEQETPLSARGEALMRAIAAVMEQFVKKTNRVSAEAAGMLESELGPGAYVDVIAANLLVRFEDKQRILEEEGLESRMQALLGLLDRELEIALMEKEIQARVKKQLDKNQREYILREQIRVIRGELGEEGEGESDALRDKANALPLPQDVREQVMKEIAKLEGMPPGSHEATVSRNWLDWVLALPWLVTDDPPINLPRSRAILERDHFALEKVKERVLEYLAVRKLVGDSLKGPILCLVGPPGVGKTSISRAIAEAMGRKFVRMSLGGVRDEAEIRGHRRTYIGAVPGRILSSMRQVGVTNPVFLLDEIDKLSSDAHGDPASALLEVLDGEQNHAFADHYLDAAYDLSHVVFIATANSADSIPRALRDRMEMIECPGYTDEEKKQIARRHLIGREYARHGLARQQMSITPSALSALLDGYTRESGVRQLERQIATICRRAALRIAEGQQKVTVTGKNIEQFLDKPVYHRQEAAAAAVPGVVTGLAWTAAGGETLQVEALRLPGNGQLKLTGQMGDVMRESAMTAASLVRAIAGDYGAVWDGTKEDWHIHIPEGAVPKDGPSAGITMALAMLSALTGRKVQSGVAMTGELTLTGRVLAVGGIQEKVLAAARAGMTTVLLPRDNLRDLDKIPQNIKDKMTFVPVGLFGEVADRALEGGVQHG